jgi:hypothetical protein
VRGTPLVRGKEGWMGAYISKKVSEGKRVER